MAILLEQLNFNIMEKDYKIITFNSKNEWLLGGRKIGGSSAATIIGANHWGSLVETWANFFDKKISPPTQSQIYGTLSEDPIREIAAINFQEWGWEIKIPPKNKVEMAQKISKPYLTATLDGSIKVIEKGLSPFNFTGLGILEIKTKTVRNSLDLEEWQGQIPPQYLTQILHYLLVYNDYSFAVLVAKLRFESEINGKWTLDHEEIKYYFVDRKDFEERIKWLEKKETEFYEKYIKGDEIPKF